MFISYVLYDGLTKLGTAELSNSWLCIAFHSRSQLQTSTTDGLH